MIDELQQALTDLQTICNSTGDETITAVACHAADALGTLSGQLADTMRADLAAAEERCKALGYYADELLTYEWLLANGWQKLDRGERQPTDHCRRAVGLETVEDEHFLVAAEDCCIDVCPDVWPNARFWFCWVTKAVTRTRQPHTWLHLRHLKTVRDIVLLYEGITGRRLGATSWRRDDLAPPVFGCPATRESDGRIR